MAEDNLLTKVNLNGTELIIGDTDARQQIENVRQQMEEGGTALDGVASSIMAIDNRLKKVENQARVITATYDAESQTLSLTSKS